MCCSVGLLAVDSTFSSLDKIDGSFMLDFQGNFVLGFFGGWKIGLGFWL